MLDRAPLLGAEETFNRALGPSQLPPHDVGVTYQSPAVPERRRTESNRPRAGLQPAT